MQVFPLALLVLCLCLSTSWAQGGSGDQDIWTELQNLKYKLAELRKELSFTNSELQNFKDQVDRLETANAAMPKVAFSAGMSGTGDVGTLEPNTPLIYSRVITNVGKAYNSLTGVFTAPVRGVYYFRFTAMAGRPNQRAGVQLYKNRELIASNALFITEHHFRYLSNGFVLFLEERDVVYMLLPAENSLHEAGSSSNTFSGLLVHPL
ncbi:hypothetical protein UPYG_G00226930 [Umbra pygmaea]|uniref:C1q domain-containing protein n=1 Tax=Umbra pygmaea TaxID=75934 RepID=A0ABD0X0E7_UMBPY